MQILTANKLALVAAALAVCASSGCATRIIQPPAPAAPMQVFIVDHGRTSSLVIPASDGGLLRYAYGDWSYYALGKTDLLHGAAALLWPTRGALGRARLEAPATLESVRRQVTSSHLIHVVHVEQARVLAFERRMEALYESRQATEIDNRAIGMTFVHHPRRYTCFGNSNHAVAAWLRELGCETRGLSFQARWRVSPEKLATPRVGPNGGLDRAGSGHRHCVPDEDFPGVSTREDCDSRHTPRMGALPGWLIAPRGTCVCCHPLASGRQGESS